MEYVLITGAYGGMGRAAALAMRDAGYCVFALDRSVPSDNSEYGIIPIEADVTSSESIGRAFDTVRGVTESLHAIVHFAGIYSLDSLVEISEERWQRIFDINVSGAYRINKTFLPLLSRGSRIVIATSELAPLDPLPFTGIYAITKAALDKYAYSLRMELQLLGIYVSVIRPGAVGTAMLGVSTDELDRFCENTKLYSCNAERFKAIVEGVEARQIAPGKIGALALGIVKAKKPKHIYAKNRNPLLLMLNVLPRRMQTWIIKKVLK